MWDWGLIDNANIDRELFNCFSGILKKHSNGDTNYDPQDLSPLADRFISHIGAQQWASLLIHDIRQEIRCGEWGWYFQPGEVDHFDFKVIDLEPSLSNPLHEIGEVELARLTHIDYEMKNGAYSNIVEMMRGYIQDDRLWARSTDGNLVWELKRIRMAFFDITLLFFMNFLQRPINVTAYVNEKLYPNNWARGSVDSPFTIRKHKDRDAYVCLAEDAIFRTMVVVYYNYIARTPSMMIEPIFRIEHPYLNFYS